LERKGVLEIEARGDVEARRDESSSTRLVPRDAESLRATEGVVFVLVFFVVFFFVSSSFGLVLAFLSPRGISDDPGPPDPPPKFSEPAPAPSVEESRRGHLNQWWEMGF
jgi:hypothetical protein